MTVQEAKKELELSRDQQDYAEEMKQRIDELNARVLSTKNHKMSDSRVQFSLNTHALEDEIVKLMDIKTEYIPFIIRMEEELFEVERKVMRLMYPYNMVLFLRYIQGENFKEIAGKLGYNKKYCNELTLEGEKLYAALLPLTAASKLNPKSDLKFYRTNNLYIEYKKKKLCSMSELKTELATMIKEVDIRCYSDCKFTGFIPRALMLREKHKAMYRKAARLKRRVEEGIAQMIDPYKEILSLHYIQGLPLIDIESQINYDYDYCKKIRSKGIKLYAK